jgi:cellulose synthase operon protein C
VSHLVPESFKAALQDCSQVAVHADPLLEGRTALLPPHLTWSFLEPQTVTPSSKLCPYRPLLITDVPTPAGLGLPPLDPWDHVPWVSGYRALRGLAATPSAALREMHEATQIIINAHGSEFGGMEGVLLSPGADKKYLLTPVDLLQGGLACAPIAVWIGGNSGGARPYQNDVWRMAAAAIPAGARASFAIHGPAPKEEVPRVLGSVFERIDAGTPPAKALHDVRMLWVDEKKSDWVKNIALFEK